MVFNRAMTQSVILKLVHTIKNNPCEININTSFEELALTSIEFIDLIVSLEEQFDFEFDDSELVIDNYKILNDIVEIVLKNGN